MCCVEQQHARRAVVSRELTSKVCIQEATAADLLIRSCFDVEACGNCSSTAAKAAHPEKGPDGTETPGCAQVYSSARLGSDRTVPHKRHASIMPPNAMSTRVAPFFTLVDANHRRQGPTSHVHLRCQIKSKPLFSASERVTVASRS